MWFAGQFFAGQFLRQRRGGGRGKALTDSGPFYDKRPELLSAMSPSFPVVGRGTVHGKLAVLMLKTMLNAQFTTGGEEERIMCAARKLEHRKLL